jgi:hypothetical protein
MTGQQQKLSADLARGSFGERIAGAIGPIARQKAGTNFAPASASLRPCRLHDRVSHA